MPPRQPVPASCLAGLPPQLLPNLGGNFIMPKKYVRRHPDIDRSFERQKALIRYRQLKYLEESELALDDKLFMENFEVAMHFLWVSPNKQ